MLRRWSWRRIARQSQHLPILTAVQLHAVGLCADHIQAERHTLQQEISGKLAPEALMTLARPLVPLELSLIGKLLEIDLLVECWDSMTLS